MQHRSVRLVMASALAMGVTLWISPGGAVAAQGIPFVDPHVHGTIGFCDRNGKPVTSGRVTDLPFVWKAVSTEPAPKAYTGPMGKAVLGVFQPRPNVDPGEWTGRQFTASSKYTNPKHPMTQATTVDRPLLDFTSVAPLWDGYAQVRMYLSNVDTPPLTSTYPATVIKITGDRWQVASTGAAPACNAGSAVSAETLHLDPSTIPSASPTLLGANGDRLPSAAASAAGTITGSPDPGAISSSTDAAPVAGASTASASSATIPIWVWLGLILLPVAGVAGGFIAARRSASGGAHSS